jgi:hypothetical protein
MIAAVSFQVSEEYAVVEAEVGQKYPAIQLSKTQPKAGEDTSFVIAEKSYKMLSGSVFERLGLREKLVYFGNSETPEHCMEITADYRILFWGIPSVCYVKNVDGKEKIRERGGDMGEGETTISRVLVSFVVNNEIVRDDNGDPQMFTFKLRSFGTQLVSKRLPELRDVIKKAANCNHSLLHVVHCGIELKPVLRKSKKNTESSWAVDLNIVDYAPFPNSEHPSLFSIASSENVRSFMKDPFFLQQKQNEQEAGERKSLIDSIAKAADTMGFEDEKTRKVFLQGFIKDTYGKNSSAELTIEQLNDMHDRLFGEAIALAEF